MGLLEQNKFSLSIFFPIIHTVKVTTLKIASFKRCLIWPKSEEKKKVESSVVLFELLLLKKIMFKMKWDI